MLRKFGESVGCVIPKPMCDVLRLDAGQTGQLEVFAQGLLIRPMARRYDLDELLAQCDLKAAMPTEVAAEWQAAAPVGRKVW